MCVFIRITNKTRIKKNNALNHFFVVVDVLVLLFFCNTVQQKSVYISYLQTTKSWVNFFRCRVQYIYSYIVKEDTCFVIQWLLIFSLFFRCRFCRCSLVCVVFHLSSADSCCCKLLTCSYIVTVICFIFVDFVRLHSSYSINLIETGLRAMLMFYFK